MSVGRRIWNHPITRIAVFLLLFFLILAALTFGLFTELRYVVRPSFNSMLVAGTILEAVAAVAALAIMVRLGDRRSLASAGIMVRGVATETVAGYLIGMAIFSLVIAIMAGVGVYHEIGSNPRFNPLLPLVVFLCAGAAEEIIFRGYIFQILERRWGSGIAILVSSLLFGFAHVGNPGPNATIWQHLAGPAFICLEAGLPLSAGYMATRRLWLPIGLHWAWNFFEGPIYGADVSGISLSTLYRARFSGPFLLTGGSFGPEASVIALVVGTVTGLLLLRVAIRAGQWRKGAEEPTPPSAAVIPPAEGWPPSPTDDQSIDQVK